MINQYINISVSSTSLNMSLALRWADFTKSTSKSTSKTPVAERFETLRPFSRYLVMRGHDMIALPTRFLGACQKRLPLYIFYDIEIDELMNGALELCPKDGLTSVTVQVLFGLLVSTGLRPGEAVRSQNQEVRLDLGEIVIQKSKGWRHCLVPLSI
jgi:site-specific recombinase XerD